MKKQFAELNRVFRECTYTGADGAVVFRTVPEYIETTKQFFDMVIEYAPIYTEATKKGEIVLDPTVQQCLSAAAAEPQEIVKKRKNLDSKIPGIPQEKASRLADLCNSSYHVLHRDITAETVAGLKTFFDGIMQCSTKYSEFVPNKEDMITFTNTLEERQDKSALAFIYEAKHETEQFIRMRDFMINLYEESSLENEKQKEANPKPKLTTPMISQSEKIKETEKQQNA